MSFVGDLLGEPDRTLHNSSVNNKEAAAGATTGTSRHLSELDISKIVAQKYAKTAQ